MDPSHPVLEGLSYADQHFGPRSIWYQGDAQAIGQLYDRSGWPLSTQIQPGLGDTAVPPLEFRYINRNYRGTNLLPHPTVQQHTHPLVPFGGDWQQIVNPQEGPLVRGPNLSYYQLSRVLGYPFALWESSATTAPLLPQASRPVGETLWYIQPVEPDGPNRIFHSSDWRAPRHLHGWEVSPPVAPAGQIVVVVLFETCNARGPVAVTEDASLATAPGTSKV